MPKRRHKKRARLPNEPKRPQSSFLLYCEDHRQQVREVNPNINPWQMSSVLGQMWKGLTKEERAVS
jgi:hypothetical protein